MLLPILLCSTRSFDLALRDIQSRVSTLGSVRAAVEAQVGTLDAAFLPTLQARLEEEPTDELWEVMDAMGEIFSMPELMRVTEGDEIIARHWNADNLGEYWELDDDEQLAVDLDGLPADSARPAENERGSGYGEVTRAGGRTLFRVMGLSASAKQRVARPVFVDLGSGAGRLVAQAWFELAPAAIIERAIGVELASSRHEAAVRAWASVRAAGDAPSLADGAEPQFVLGSLLDVDLTDATHVYVASLLMRDDLLDKLWARLRDPAQTPRLAVVASLREFRAADADGVVSEVHQVAMNWNEACRVYVYRIAANRELS